MRFRHFVTTILAVCRAINDCPVVRRTQENSVSDRPRPWRPAYRSSATGVTRAAEQKIATHQGGLRAALMGLWKVPRVWFAKGCTSRTGPRVSASVGFRLPHLPQKVWITLMIYAGRAFTLPVARRPPAWPTRQGQPLRAWQPAQPPSAQLLLGGSSGSRLFSRTFGFGGRPIFGFVSVIKEL